MKTTVSIKGAEFHAYHGYYEEERLTGNTFCIDAEVELKSFDFFPNSNKIANVYDHLDQQEFMNGTSRPGIAGIEEPFIKTSFANVKSSIQSISMIQRRMETQIHGITKMLEQEEGKKQLGELISSMNEINVSK